MNTIGRMGKGQWAYYQDAVAAGREDYYAAGGKLVDDPRWKHPGYDLTFRGSKSISVLWALGDRQTREAVEGSLDRANEQMLGWLEDKIAFGRVMGAGGQPERVRGTGLTVATYAHNVSR